mgnify:CR=1 FL=1
MRRALAAATGLLLMAGGVAAHEAPAQPGPAAWSGEAWLWLLWGLPGLLVLAGTARLWQQAGVGAGVSRLQATSFVLGWWTLGLCLLSPLDAFGQVLFWAHMVQHELMMLVAAPLLVLARPLGPLVWGLPTRWRPGAATLARGLGLQAAMRLLTRPAVAWWVHAVVLWGWHAPSLFSAALVTRWVHELQHTSFLLAALVFWWSVLPLAGRGREGPAMFSVFTTLLHTGLLGALLTFSERAWYAPYVATAPARGMSAVEDQQLGGLIMWVPGSVAYLAAALVLCAAWLQASGSRRAGWAQRPRP